MQNADIALLALIGLTFVGVLLAVVISHVAARRRARQPRPKLGPEYARVVAQYNREAGARRALLARERRVKKLNIHLLSPDQCERFGSAWRAVQRRFAQDPRGAVVEANGLVKDVMRMRGYPIGDFKQRLADLPIEHASVLNHYRSVRILALANAIGKAGAEDLRDAMQHYQALFADLLQTQGPQPELSVVRT
ncbi:MAG: hypothetical protein QM778_29405 [Myxococcales bacterium]